MKSQPLEREYEAWVMAQVEATLEQLGFEYRAAAVSPWDEASWPADEELGFGGKFVGLQFKRPDEKRLSDGRTVAKWDLRQPRGQLVRIKVIPEIYYALPTFLTRDFRRAALASCYFWRPPKRHRKMTFDLDWIRGHAMMFGEFMQEILDCRIGFKVPSGQPSAPAARNFLMRYVGRSEDRLIARGADDGIREPHGEGETVHILWLGVGSAARSVG